MEITHGSLFSGIGGFDFASEQIGWSNIFQVEIDKWCRKILSKNFQNVKQYEDIKEFDGKQYEGKISVITGGFPCQPVSVAGKRKADDDERFLWKEMYRVIGQIKPTYVVAENVQGLLTAKQGILFEQVCVDLETIGYEVQPFIIPACSVNAPHRRSRIWIIAYCDSTSANNSLQTRRKEFTELYNDADCNCEWKLQSERMQQKIGKRTGNFCENVTFSESIRQQRWIKNKSKRKAQWKFRRLDREFEQWETEPGMGRVVNGLSGRVDRIKGLGNAIVPQVAFQIFKFIDCHLKYLNGLEQSEECGGAFKKKNL